MNQRSCLLALALAASSLVASATEAPPAACSTPSFRQFDFWLGNWTVTDPKDEKKVLGRNEITSELGGCNLHERWTGAKGFKGESFNAFDEERGVWHQTWIDQGGGLLVLEGGLKQDSMVLEGRHAPKGVATIERVTWTPLAKGAVRQLWETSADGGKTWSVSFDGMYRKG